MLHESGTSADIHRAMVTRPKRPHRTTLSLTEFERDLINQARGDTGWSKFIREAALARAAWELGQRSAEPVKTLRQTVERLRAQ